MKCRFRGAGGLGGSSAPPSSTPDPNVSSSCLFACLLTFLFGFFSAKQTSGKNKTKKRKENSCQSRKATKAKSRKTKTQKVEKQQKQKNSRSRKAAKAEKQQKQKNAEAEKQQKQKHSKIRIKKYKNNPETKRTSINMVDGSFVYCCLILFFIFLVVLPLLRCFFGCLASILPAFLTSYLDPFFPSFTSLRPGDQGLRGPGDQGDQGTKGTRGPRGPRGPGRPCGPGASIQEVLWTRSKHTRDGKEIFF